MGVESGGDGWRRGSRENGDGERKWSWKGTERSWGKWNVVRGGDQACEDVSNQVKIWAGVERTRGMRSCSHESCLLASVVTMVKV